MSQDPTDRFITRLRQLRRHYGLTQEQLAERAKLNYKHYQEIEGGRKRDIRLSTINQIAEAFGISIAALFPEGHFAEESPPEKKK